MFTVKARQLSSFVHFVLTLTRELEQLLPMPSLMKIFGEFLYIWQVIFFFFCFSVSCRMGVNSFKERSGSNFASIYSRQERNLPPQACPDASLQSIQGEENQRLIILPHQTSWMGHVQGKVTQFMAMLCMLPVWILYRMLTSSV